MVSSSLLVTAIGPLHSPASRRTFDGGKRATACWATARGSYYSSAPEQKRLASDWLPIASNWTGLMPMRRAAKRKWRKC